MASTAEGADNATEDVLLHTKPGRTRAPFLRYIRINLPRLTKAILLIAVAVICATAAAVAVSSFEIFAGSGIALWIAVAAAAIFVLLGLITAWRIWTYGAFVALTALLVYIGGLVGTAPFVWNGASTELAATWNLMLFAAIGYLLLYWALNYGMLVAYPDDQDFKV